MAFRIKKIKRHYKCIWCKKEFDQEVGYVTGQSGGRKAAVSDQVKCICGNFLQTWPRVKGVKTRK